MITARRHSRATVFSLPGRAMHAAAISEFGASADSGDKLGHAFELVVGDQEAPEGLVGSVADDGDTISDEGLPGSKIAVHSARVDRYFGLARLSAAKHQAALWALNGVAPGLPRSGLSPHRA